MYGPAQSFYYCTLPDYRNQLINSHRRFFSISLIPISKKRATALFAWYESRVAADKNEPCPHPSPNIISFSERAVPPSTSIRRKEFIFFNGYDIEL
jgi:hypothetical protein